MKGKKLIKLGLLMAVTIFLFIWGLSYLKGHDFFSPVDYYHAVYDRVDGLVKSGHVTMNGYKVGSVKNVQFAPDRSGRLIVTFMIDNNFRIPRNSTAQIVSSDLMGTRAVRLEFSGETEYHKPGDTLRSDIESDLKEQVSLQVLPLKNKAEELLGTIDSAITVLTVIFNEDARKNLAESFENINQTIANIERTSADLAQLISDEKTTISKLTRNIESFTGTLSSNATQFDNIIKNLSAFSDTIAKMPLSPVLADVSDIIDNMRNLIAKVENDDNSLGLLFSDDQLYNNLSSMTDNLGHLLTDIRVNPKRYVHFSAIDLGREVYINTGTTPVGSSPKVVFRVHYISTPDQIALNSELFEGLGEVEEYAVSGAFTYTSGDMISYEEAEKRLNAAYRNFPDASIIAFRDGKVIKLERALRMLK